MPNRIFTSKLTKISVKDLASTDFSKPLILKITDIKSKFIFSKIKKYILGKKILDIGTGIGGFAAFLTGEGFDVTSIDVDNSSAFKEFPTQLYDGNKIPYDDNSFDTAVIIHVLHHCSDRLQVLKEALRVSKRVLFIEDTYRNKLEWAIVSFNDMLGNNEFYTHPYSTPEEWREILIKENCEVLYAESYSRFTYHVLYGRYVLFVVEKK